MGNTLDEDEGDQAFPPVYKAALLKATSERGIQWDGAPDPSEAEGKPQLIFSGKRRPEVLTGILSEQFKGYPGEPQLVASYQYTCGIA